MTGKLYLGTSGFAYPEWKGDFYPPDLKADAMLAFYARRLSSVEINYTFQNNPSEKTLAKWIADTPEDFVFSLKAHRAITHMFRLSPGAAGPLEELLTSCGPLGRRLGAIFFQLPPNMKADLPRLETFLASLPRDHRYAFEFRHGTWNDAAVYDLLRAHEVAWCVADTDEIPCSFVRTATDFAYLRLRKTVYEDEELVEWAKQIGEALADGVDVYCYFKHKDESRGVHFAQALGGMLGAGSSEAPSSQESLPGF
ncbi:MAG: DUF72 domain-containing protein [Actinomycetota bacterium]